MPDVFTKAKRSEVMSKIRGKGNKDTEVALAKLFRANGITGWRRHYPIIGRPDFTFPKHKIAVFVDGCFWHGCPKPKHAPLPKNRAEWWAAKLARNKARDRLVRRTLRAEGWRVLRVWECELTKKNWARIARRLDRVLASW